jgi:phosphatidylglycerophosphate synthase
MRAPDHDPEDRDDPYNVTQASRIYFLPNLMTAGNLFCGFMAVLNCIYARLAETAINGEYLDGTPADHYRYAVWFILGAAAFDTLDGRLARMGGRESLFGAEFDSLADVVSFGFAPALSATLWLVLAVYGLESRFVPLQGVRRRLAVLGCVVIVLAWAFPGQLHPQLGSPWAPLHWLLGIASYGLFGVAVLHAALVNRAERQLRRAPGAASPTGGVPLLRLERLTYQFVAAGFVVLSAAIALGVWFTSPWRWDHKAVFSIPAEQAAAMRGPVRVELREALQSGGGLITAVDAVLQ